MDYNESYELKPDEELGIDPEKLDVHWIQHPDLFHKYAVACAHAEKKAKEAHERVKIVRSRLIKDANSNPDKCLGRGNKPTATNVEAYYRDHPDHVEAKEEFILAEYERDIYTSAKSAMYIKKTALENLVKLAVQGWFAAPISPKTMTELKEQIEEEDRRITSRMVNLAKKKGKMKRKKRPKRSE